MYSSRCVFIVALAISFIFQTSADTLVNVKELPDGIVSHMETRTTQLPPCGKGSKGKGKGQRRRGHEIIENTSHKNYKTPLNSKKALRKHTRMERGKSLLSRMALSCCSIMATDPPSSAPSTSPAHSGKGKGTTPSSAPAGKGKGTSPSSAPAGKGKGKVGKSKGRCDDTEGYGNKWGSATAQMKNGVENQKILSLFLTGLITALTTFYL